MLETTRHSALSPFTTAQTIPPPPATDIQPSRASTEPVLWATALSLDLLLGPGQYRTPIAAGRPDVLLFDATSNQLKSKAWHGWNDMSDHFRVAGVALDPSRRVMVQQRSEVEKDIREGLKWQQTKTEQGLSLARSFYDGHNRSELDAVCSLIRLGLTEPHATRNLAHYMAIKAGEPPAGEGVSLVERLKLLKCLFEEPQQLSNGQRVWSMPPAYTRGGYLTHRNEFGQSPLDLAILTRNKPMEDALRVLTDSQPAAIEQLDMLTGVGSPHLEPRLDFTSDDLLDLTPPNLELAAQHIQISSPVIAEQPIEQPIAPNARELTPSPDGARKLASTSEARRSERLLKKRQRSNDTAFVDHESSADTATGSPGNKHTEIKSHSAQVGSSRRASLGIRPEVRD